MRPLIFLLLAQLPPTSLNLNGQPITLRDEGVKKGSSLTTIDCVGAGVTCSKDGGTIYMSVPGGGAGPGGKVDEAYVADASAWSRVSQISYAADASIWAETAQTAYSADASALAYLATAATALASDPTACPGGQFVTDLAANGTLTCATPSGGGGGKVAEAYMADASITAEQLATDPTACTAGQFVTDLAANGTLTCAAPPGGGSGLTYAETAWSSLGGF